MCMCAHMHHQLVATYAPTQQQKMSAYVCLYVFMHARTLVAPVIYSVWVNSWYLLVATVCAYIYVCVCVCASTFVIACSDTCALACDLPSVRVWVWPAPNHFLSHSSAASQEHSISCIPQPATNEASNMLRFNLPEVKHEIF